MIGLLTLVAGIFVIKLLGNDLGWILFVLGCVIGCKGGISLSQSGAKEIGN